MPMRHVATARWLRAGALVATALLTAPALADTQTRTVAYNYVAYTASDPRTALVQSQQVEPGDGAYALTTAYTYDGHGNATATTVSGVGLIARTSTTSYDSLGLFPVQGEIDVPSRSGGATVAFIDKWLYDPQFGGLSSHTDPNNLTTTWQYDTFGRRILEVRPDGNQTKSEYFYCTAGLGAALPSDAACPAGASYMVQTTPLSAASVQNGARLRVYYDALEREVRRETQHFGDGAAVYTDTSYDQQGRVAQISRPYLAATGTAHWSARGYDVLGRMTVLTHEDGSTVQFGYNGLITTTTDELSHVTTTTRNSLNQIVAVQDAASATTSFAYDAFGNLTGITDAAGNVTTASYNIRGWRTSLNDPDAGQWSYGYDALGELLSRTDAKSQTTAFAYDALGRLVARDAPDIVSAWLYDPTNAIGQLAEDYTYSYAKANFDYVRAYYYDPLARLTTIGMISNLSAPSAVATIGYNSDGRVNLAQRPSGLKLSYGYDGYGHPSTLSDGTSGTVYWQANNTDAEGHLTQETLGNGMVTTRGFDANRGWLTSVGANLGATTLTAESTWYDALGNVTGRSDTVTALSESYAYDGLNRLTGVATAGPNNLQLAKTISYDAIGNITAKSGTGTYSYPAAGAARPHAVTTITPTVAGQPTLSYGYDANGNMTSWAGGSLTYTGGNMVSTLAKGAYSFIYTYTAQQQRIEQALKSGSSAAATFYVGFDPLTHSERRVGGTVNADGSVTYGGTVTWVDYLDVAGEQVGSVTTTVPVSGTTTTAVSYFHADHLGSVMAISTSTGSVTAQSYDAWGKRRYPGGQDDATGSITSPATHGYIGEEAIDQIGLVNLNRRLYDPAIGRFLGPDPLAQGVLADPQGLNRYAYVQNRPLSLTDPTGLSDWESRQTDFGTQPDPANGDAAAQAAHAQVAARDAALRDAYAHPPAFESARAIGSAVGTAFSNLGTELGMMANGDFAAAATYWKDQEVAYAYAHPEIASQIADRLADRGYAEAAERVLAGTQQSLGSDVFNATATWLLAAAGDLKCRGGYCESGGSYGSTAMYRYQDRDLCPPCAVKLLGIVDLPHAEQEEILRPFLRKGQ